MHYQSYDDVAFPCTSKCFRRFQTKGPMYEIKFLGVLLTSEALGNSVVSPAAVLIGGD